MWLWKSLGLGQLACGSGTLMCAADKAAPGEGVETSPHPPELSAGLLHTGRLPASYFRQAPGKQGHIRV